MSAIEFKGITKFYGRTRGIEDLNLSINQSEIFGFLGPNGAGKTTTIRLIMNLLRADAGEILLWGEKINPNASRYLEDVGYLPGDFAPYADMKAHRFLKYLSRFRRRDPILREKLLKELKLPDSMFKKKIKQLSHGNRQKLGIILALEHQPRLAILDEPTLGLDPLVQESLYETLRELSAEGTTIFLSSHILTEVEKNCARVAIVREGKLVANDSIEALRRKKRRRLIIDLESLDTPPPAIDGCTFVKTEGRRVTYSITGELPYVMQQLEGVNYTDVILPEADLEDIFLGYYAGKGGEQ